MPSSPRIGARSRASLRTHQGPILIALCAFSCATTPTPDISQGRDRSGVDSCEAEDSQKPKWLPCPGAPPPDPWADLPRYRSELVAYGSRAVSVTGPRAVPSGGDSPALSGNGKWVAYASSGAHAGTDDNRARDVFLRDLEGNRTFLVSGRDVTPPGEEIPRRLSGNASSDEPSVSGDGCVVAYSSYASDLVPNDTNGKQDVFVWDRCHGGRTELISRKRGLAGFEPFPAIGHSFSPSVSGDGRYVVFASEANDLVEGDSLSSGTAHIYLFDRTLLTMRRLSVGVTGEIPNGPSGEPVISADGRRVAFSSVASNLVASDTNGHQDVFYIDTALGSSIQLASRHPSGVLADGPSGEPAINGNGDVIAFTSNAANLLVGDRTQKADGNDTSDVFVLSTRFATLRRVSLSMTKKRLVDGSWQDDWEEFGVRYPSYRPSLDYAGMNVAYTVTSPWAIMKHGDGDYCLTNEWDTNGVADVVVVKLSGPGGPPEANRFASVTPFLPLPNTSPEDRDPRTPRWNFSHLLGNGASETEGSQLLSWDGQRVVYTSLAPNLSGMTTEAYDPRYLCQVTPGLGGTKAWSPVPLWNARGDAYDVFINDTEPPYTFYCTGRLPTPHSN